MVIHVIYRSEAEDLRRLRRVILYGRRKVGKSFLVRYFLKPTHYFFVLRSGDLVYLRGGERRSLSYGEFMGLFEELVSRPEYFVVVDEFQRLPGEFLDFLHVYSPSIRARLFLVGSSFRFTQRIVASRSSLLGLFQVYRLDLVRCRDIYAYFGGKLRGRELVKALVFLRDPWLLPFYSGSVDDAVIYSLRNVPGLIGEVFAEEDRSMTETYERVVRALAMGNYLPRDVSSYTSKPLNEVKPYLYNLMEMGLVKRVKVYGKRKWLYKLRSPMVDLFYYLDTKYGVSELEVAREVLLREVERKLPLYFEDFVREALAERYGGVEEVSLSPEVDGIITVGKRPVVCIEVKLGGVTRWDREHFLGRVSRFRCEKLVISPSNLGEIFA